MEEQKVEYETKVSYKTIITSSMIFGVFSFILISAFQFFFAKSFPVSLLDPILTLTLLYILFTFVKRKSFTRNFYEKYFSLSLNKENKKPILVTLIVYKISYIFIYFLYSYFVFPEDMEFFIPILGEFIIFNLLFFLSAIFFLSDFSIRSLSPFMRSNSFISTLFLSVLIMNFYNCDPHSKNLNNIVLTLGNYQSTSNYEPYKDSNVPGLSDYDFIKPLNGYDKKLTHFFALVSQDVYSEETKNVDYNLQKIGFEKSTISYPISDGFGLQAVANYKKIGQKGIIIISFRGTQGFADVMRDLNIVSFPFKAGDKTLWGVNVHMGFLGSKNGFENREDKIVFPKLGDSLRSIIDKKSDITFFITGHSLGGAIATLYSASLYERGIKSENIRVLTYGAPSVGNDKFVERYDHKYYQVRIRNEHDLVPYSAYLSFLKTYLLKLGFEIVNPKISEILSHPFIKIIAVAKYSIVLGKQFLEQYKDELTQFNLGFMHIGNNYVFGPEGLMIQTGKIDLFTKLSSTLLGRNDDVLLNAGTSEHAIAAYVSRVSGTRMPPGVPMPPLFSDEIGSYSIEEDIHIQIQKGLDRLPTKLHCTIYDRSSFFPIKELEKITNFSMNLMDDLIFTTTKKGEKEIKCKTINEANLESGEIGKIIYIYPKVQSVTIQGKSSFLSGATECYSSYVQYYDIQHTETKVVTEGGRWSIDQSSISVDEKGCLITKPLLNDLNVKLSSKIGARTYTKNILVQKNSSAMVLESVFIEGPSEIDENSSICYEFKGRYNDGNIRSLNLLSFWSTDDNKLAIFNKNCLTTGSVDSDRTINISAHLGDIQASFSVRIRNTGSSEILKSISIQGPNEVKQTDSVCLTLEADYSSGSKMTVSNGISWREGSTYASILSNGCLQVANAPIDEVIVVTAEFNSIRTSKSIKILSEGNKITGLSIEGPNLANGGETICYNAYISFVNGDRIDYSNQVIWQGSNTVGTVSNTGCVKFASINSNSNFILRAEYNTYTSEKTISVLAKLSAQKVPSGLEISGNSSISEKEKSCYQLYLNYNDGSSDRIDSTRVSWSGANLYGSVDSYGCVLSEREISSNVLFTFSASYSGFITQKQITIVDTLPNNPDMDLYVNAQSVSSSGSYKILSEIAVGSASNKLPLRIKNSGMAALSISSIEMISGNTLDFLIDVSENITLNSGESMSGTIVFVPTLEGQRSVRIRIQNNDPNYPNFEFTVIGTAKMANIPTSLVLIEGETTYGDMTTYNYDRNTFKTITSTDGNNKVSFIISKVNGAGMVHSGVYSIVNQSYRKIIKEGKYSSGSIIQTSIDKSNLIIGQNSLYIVLNSDPPNNSQHKSSSKIKIQRND
ncbi:MAG: hypothetical protein KDK54_21305 [Leptospiraceae bacterium]|nr:hypothetical protein [Leptospiraceae bacterium]